MLLVVRGVVWGCGEIMMASKQKGNCHMWPGEGDPGQVYLSSLHSSGFTALAEEVG